MFWSQNLHCSCEATSVSAHPGWSLLSIWDPEASKDLDYIIQAVWIHFNCWDPKLTWKDANYTLTFPSATYIQDLRVSGDAGRAVWNHFMLHCQMLCCIFKPIYFRIAATLFSCREAPEIFCGPQNFPRLSTSTRATRTEFYTSG